MSKSVKWIINNIKCGVCSGFRLCCCLYHTFVYVPILDLVRNTRFYKGWIDSHATNSNYIECPLCRIMKRDFVKMKRCFNGCYCGSYDDMTNEEIKASMTVVYERQADGTIKKIK